MRLVLERLGLRFAPETEPPFSFEGGPVASTGARLETGEEFWLYAAWDWDEGEFKAPPIESEHHPLVISAAPTQFESPAEAVAAFAAATSISPSDADWIQSAWLGA